MYDFQWLPVPYTEGIKKVDVDTRPNTQARIKKLGIQLHVRDVRRLRPRPRQFIRTR